jgi:transposase-like protein
MRPQRWASKAIMMKRTRIRKLRDADRMLAEQKSIAEIAKELGVSENTYHRWCKPVRRDEGQRRQEAQGA